MDTFFHSPGEPGKKTLPGYFILLIIVALLLIALVAWMIIKKKKPSDLPILFKLIIARVWEGITAIRHLKKKVQFILLTIMLWSLYLFGGYIGFFALQETEHYGIKEAFTVLSAGSVGMVVTPGGIGAYALILEKTMQLYGSQKGIALAFGWLLWLVQTSVIVIGGLISFAALPYYNKRKLREPG
jgi:MFS family permease